MKNLYIPALGTTFTLAKDWEFDLFWERRNETLLKKFGFIRDGESVFFSQKRNIPPEKIALPKGSKLKIDRIYVRKGQKEFNSVTFFLVGVSQEMERTCRVRGKEVGLGYGNWKIENCVIKKPIRFWAKLEDVNKIYFKEE